MSLESNSNSTAAPSTGTIQHSTSVVLGNSRSPVFEPKREDLTSRLQKEFGLLVDTDTNSDSGDQINNPDDVGDGEGSGGVGGDATPEEDSPPPPPPSGSSGSTRFLPSQIPSYTTPTTGYPASSAASVAQQPPVPHVHHYSSSGVSRAKYPPPPPPPSSMNQGGYQVNFPPPPPPTSGLSFGKDDHSQPPPQPLPPPPPAPLPALKANGPAGGQGGLTSNSSRRPLPSKDYYNRGSPGSGAGGRGYYTSHRDRSRDHGGHHRDHDHHRERGGSDHRDHGRDRDYRSQSSSSSSSSSSRSRNAYQSRNYY